MPHIPDLPELPAWIDITGDEDGGITLYCRNASHGPNAEPIAYHGWSADSGLACADNLTQFIQWTYQHVAIHEQPLPTASLSATQLGSDSARRPDRTFAPVNGVPAYKTTAQEKPVPSYTQMKETLDALERNRQPAARTHEGRGGRLEQHPAGDREGDLQHEEEQEQVEVTDAAGRVLVRHKRCGAIYLHNRHTVTQRTPWAWATDAGSRAICPCSPGHPIPNGEWAVVYEDGQGGVTDEPR